MGITGERKAARRNPRFGNGGALGNQRKWRERESRQLGQNTPPAMRRTTVRELLPLLHPPGQVGLPPTMKTDPLLGSSRTAYQSAHVSMNLCVSEKFASVRLLGGTPPPPIRTHERILREGRTRATAHAVPWPRMWRFCRRMRWGNSTPRRRAAWRRAKWMDCGPLDV